MLAEITRRKASALQPDLKEAPSWSGKVITQAVSHRSGRLPDEHHFRLCEQSGPDRIGVQEVARQRTSPATDDVRDKRLELVPTGELPDCGRLTLLGSPTYAQFELYLTAALVWRDAPARVT